MNICKVFLSIIFIMSEEIQNISCCYTSDVSFNFFHKNTKTIRHTMNKVFTLLNLKDSFKKPTKIRLLIAMHKNLMKILSNNYKIDLGNICDNTTIKEFPEHDNIIYEILEEEYSLLFYPLNETVKQDVQNTTLNNSFTEHFSGYLQILLSNIDKFTSQELNTTEPAPSTTDSFVDHDNTSPNALDSISGNKSAGRIIPHHNLKSWVPDAHQNFAYNRRIYRSKNTKIKKYPFLASVHVSGKFVCGGSIISKDHVLTAASCLQTNFINRNNSNYNSDIFVRVGSDVTSVGGQSVPISYIDFHPKYDDKTLKNNLVLLRMENHKFVSKSKIRRVLYDKTPDDLPSDVKRVTIVGWGGKTKNQSESLRLGLAHLDLYELDECKAVYTNTFVDESNFCAGYVTRGSGACNKDIGDPGVIAGVLVGVVSFGPPVCGTPDAPTVFTRVGIYANWIESIIVTDPNGTPKPIVRTLPYTIEPIIKQDKPVSDVTDSKIIRLGKMRMEVPEEYFMVQEILKDIATSNSTGIKTANEEGFEDDFFEFLEEHPKVDVQHSPLANRSLFGIPGLNFPEEIATFGKEPTLPPSFDLNEIKTNDFGLDFPEQRNNKLQSNKDYNELGKIIEVLYDYFASKESTRLDDRKINVAKRYSTRKRKIERTTPLHIDTSASNNYEDTGSEGGMSIEINTTPKPAAIKMTRMIFASDERSSNMQVKKSVKRNLDNSKTNKIKRHTKRQLTTRGYTRLYKYKSSPVTTKRISVMMTDPSLRGVERNQETASSDGSLNLENYVLVQNDDHGTIFDD